jgi:UDP-glucuronate 4-epimerase
VVRVLERPPKPGQVVEPPDPSVSSAPYRLFNIGNHTPVELTRFIDCLEKALGLKAVRHLMPMQPGDVVATCADVSALAREVGFEPSTPLEEGLERFVNWYREYYENE